MDDREREQVAELVAQPGWAVLHAWVEERQEAALRTIAKKLYGSPDTVDSVYLREVSAEFRGMNRLLNQPLLAFNAMEQHYARREAARD